MKIYNIFFAVIIINSVKSDTDSDEARYIDLLPEKEKEEFLEKISRRIFNDVQTKDARHRYSGEMSDEQLDEHNDFVQKILKEESANLRKSNVNEKKEEDRKSEENMKVQALERKKISIDNVGHIDLTLREGKETGGNGFSGDPVNEGANRELNNTYYAEETKIKPETIFNAVTIDKNTRNINDLVKSDVEDIQVKNFRRNSLEDESEKQSSSERETTNMPRRTVMIEPETRKSYTTEVTTVTDFRLEDSTTDKLDTTTTASEGSGQLKSNEENSRDSQSTNESQQHLDDTDKKSVENNRTTKLTNIPEETTTISVEADKSSLKNVSYGENESQDDQFYRYLRSAKEETDINEIHNLNYSLAKTVNNFTEGTLYTTDIVNTDATNIIPVTRSIVNDDKPTVSHILDGHIKNVSLVKTPLTKNNLSDIDTKDVNNITLLLPTNKNLSYQESNKDKNNLSNVNTNSTNSDVVANEIIRTLRNEVLLHNNKNTNDNSFSDLKTLRSSIDVKSYNKATAKEHKVYEIPPNQQEKTADTEEPPYFVPVYNYSPDNAYYNPHNRLGPNAEYPSNERIVIDSQEPLSDENKDIIDLDRDNMLRERKFSFVNKNLKYPKLVKNTPYKLNMPVVMTNPSIKFFNPDDYVDMDVYYDRMHLERPVQRKRCDSHEGSEEYNEKDTEGKEPLVFPDFDEDGHSSHSPNNLQGHIRAIRKILYQNKYFGYIPPYYEMNGNYANDKVTNLRSKMNRVVAKPKLKTNDKNKAVEYYFGRLQNEPNDEAKGGYIKKINSIRDLDYKVITEDIKKDYHHPPPPYPYSNERDNIKAIKRDRIIYSPKEKKQNLKDAINTKKILKKKKPKHKPVDFDVIRTILSASDAKDIVINLDKLININTTVRSRSDNEFEVYVTVLKDMVHMDNEALEQYDWLGTTVDVQAALAKLMALAESIQIKENISRLDLQLLKYLTTLHKSSKYMVDSMETETRENKLRSMKKELLPRNKRKKKKNYLKEKGLLNRVWLFRGGYLNDKSDHNNTAEKDVDNFYDFLKDLQFYLYYLHNAIKHIAMVTKYHQQHWFEDLKRIYLTSNDKELLQILLHLTTTRLLGLVEESAKNGAEDNYITYIKENVQDVVRTREELVFVLRLLNQLKEAER